MSIKYEDLEKAYRDAAKSLGNTTPSYGLMTLGMVRYIAKRIPDLAPELEELVHGDLPDSTLLEIAGSWIKAG